VTLEIYYSKTDAFLIILVVRMQKGFAVKNFEYHNVLVRNLKYAIACSCYTTCLLCIIQQEIAWVMITLTFSHQSYYNYILALVAECIEES